MIYKKKISIFSHTSLTSFRKITLIKTVLMNFAGKGVESTGRTFGVKRIQFMLMPMMYKMGAMMTLLTVLTVISLKGLLIGKVDGEGKNPIGRKKKKKKKKENRNQKKK